MAKKLLLVLQTSPYDFEQAKALMRLIADLEEKYNHTADFLLCIRKDMSFPRAELDYISSKFNVHTFQTRNLVDGWPLGCNIMWMEVATYVAYKCKRREWDYDVMLTFEPDCVPLRKGWIEELYDEWRRSQPCTFLGSYTCPAPDGTIGIIPDTWNAHYNGNMLIATNFVDICPSMRGPAMVQGWDVYFANSINPNGRPSRLIVNDYRRHLPNQQEMSEEELFAPRTRAIGHPHYGEVLKPCFLHGAKKMSAIEHVRNRLLRAPKEEVVEAPAPKAKKAVTSRKVLTQPTEPQG